MFKGISIIHKLYRLDNNSQILSWPNESTPRHRNDFATKPFLETQNTKHYKNSPQRLPKPCWLSLNAHQSSLVPRLHAELHAVQSPRVVQWPFLLIEFVLGMRSRGGRHSCNGNPSEEWFGCFSCFGMFQLLWVASVVSFALGVSVVSVAT